MERSDDSDTIVILREVGCLLLMLILGLLFILPLATLAYFTYQTVNGSATFCTLWIDVPGRLTIFVTCYYIASVCGFLPLSRHYRVRNCIQPINIWRVESWRRLFRNVCFPTPSPTLIKKLQRNAELVQGNAEASLLQNNNQDCYGSSEKSKSIDIPYPKSYVAPVFVSDPERTPQSESLNTSPSGSVASIDSSIGNIAVPIIKRKSSKRRYISESSFEQSDNPSRVSSKYRKRYTLPKWAREPTINTHVPVSDDRTVERPGRVRVGKKSTALTEDERLMISRKHRRLINEIKAHAINALNEPSFCDDASERTLDEKAAVLADSKKLASIRHKEQPGSVTEISEEHVADKQFKEFATNEPYPETRVEPRMYDINQQVEGVIHDKHRESSSKCRERYNETKRIIGGISHTSAAVASEQSLEEKHFSVTGGLRLGVTKRYRTDVRNQQPEGITDNCRKPLPKYSETKKTGEDSNVSAPMLDDHAFIRVANQQPSDEKHFANSGQKEILRSENENFALYAADKRLKGPSGKEKLLKTNNKPKIHERKKSKETTTSDNRGTLANLQKTDTQFNSTICQQSGAIASNELEMSTKVCNTGKQLIVVGNPQSGRSDANNERKIADQSGNTETSLNFPRFPWTNLRNPKGVSKYASKLHKKNLELEKREMERYSLRCRKQADLDRLVRSQLCSERVTETRLPRSNENINLTMESSFRTEYWNEIPKTWSDICSEYNRSKLFRIKQDIEGANASRSAREKIANENVKREQLQDLKKKPLHVKQSIHCNIAQSKKKTDTSNTSDKNPNEAIISMKPCLSDAAENPDVKILIDSNVDVSKDDDTHPEQSGN